MPLYPIVTLEVDLPTKVENLGTKEKHWLELDGTDCLIKFGRPDTGEDWAEKAACELAGLLGLPHAHYDLASSQGRTCVLTPTLTPNNERLIFGNELIYNTLKSDGETRFYQQRSHTVRRVHAAIKTFTRRDDEEAASRFCGYLLFDAWIGNTDRHHQNWGLIFDRDRKIRLCPTFDHASSLGRELTDAVKERRLTSRDQRFDVATFASRGRSALYDKETDRRPLSLVDAFLQMGRLTKSTSYWIDKVSQIRESDVKEVFDNFPAGIVTDWSKRFAIALLSHNRDILTGAKHKR